MISEPIEIPGLDIDNLPPATEHTAAVVIDPRGLVGMEEITTKITLDNLPGRPLWEEDGACWRAILEPFEPKGWRWQPLNLKAFGKAGPTGPMTDYYRPRQEEPHG